MNRPSPLRLSRPGAAKRTTPTLNLLALLENPTILDILVLVEQSLSYLLEVGILAGARQDEAALHLI